ncbi:MAG: metalloregulator ArsR/SmtB family transcription factor [Bryobacteraceae bacterium]
MQAKRLKSRASVSASIFAALGDERRLRLVGRLCTDGPVSITRLTSGSDISRQAVTKHLHVLARAGLVRGVRKGRERVYEFDGKQLQQARQYLDIVSRQWDEALSRLKLLVEKNRPECSEHSGQKEDD